MSVNVREERKSTLMRFRSRHVIDAATTIPDTVRLSIDTVNVPVFELLCAEFS